MARSLHAAVAAWLCAVFLLDAMPVAPALAGTATHLASAARRSLGQPQIIAVNAPVARDTCVQQGPPAHPGWGVAYNCYLQDVGAKVTVTYGGANKYAQFAGNPQSCPDPTNWWWSGFNNPNTTVQVTVSPATTSNGGGCHTTDPPISVALTRVAPIQGNIPLYQGNTKSSYTFCYPPSSGGCGGPLEEAAIAIWLYEDNSAPPLAPERPCGRCNGTTIGHPVDVATGELWNEKNDLQLSGPFALRFTRFYGSQTPGSTDLGASNWRHNYAARLDTGGAVAGYATYYDYQGMPYYFSGVTAGGAAAYDNYTGMSLALSSDGSTYTLTDFGHQTWTFNAAGELTATGDRAGNAQTIARDTTAGHFDRITSVTDALQRKLCFYYDGSNRISSVAAWMQTSACPSSAPASSASAPVVTMTYDNGPNCSYGQLCAVTEADGNAWAYQYADSNTSTNLTKVSDPLGDPEEINTYSGTKLTHQETGACSGTSPCADTGGYLNITYPTSGSTVTVTDGLSRTSSVTYDPNSLLLTNVTGPVCRCGGDQTRSYTYDVWDRLLTASDDAVDGSTKHTFTSTYGRDANGLAYPGPTSITENLDTAGTTRTVTMAYYPVGDSRQDRVQTTTLPSVDAPGSTMTIADTYSTAGLLTQRTTTGFVNGVQTSYTRRWAFDARGRMTSETGPRTDVTQTTTYGYYADNDTDAARAGQLRTITDPLSHTTTYAAAVGFTSYSPFGGAQSVVDPNGVTIQYVFDAGGRPTSGTLLPTTEGESNLVTRFAYDAAGRRTQVTRPLGNATMFGYDTSNRMTEVSRADSSLAKHERVAIAYNAADQPTSVSAQTCPTPASSCAAWSSAAWTLTYGYSATTSDLAQITNADNTSKRVTYTAQGALATYNDENHTTGNDDSMGYDLAGRLLTETHVLAGAPGGVATTSKTYDAHNNVTSITDPNGNATTYHFDDFDRITKETSPTTGVKTYAYDADGNLVSTTNANGTTASYTYDALNRMLTENDVKGSATASEAWTYDDTTSGHFGIGQVATTTDPSGSAGYTYDRLGNLQVENKNVNGTVYTYGYGYDLNGNRQSMTYPDGTIVSFGFDFADRPYSASQVGPQGPLSSIRRPSSRGLSLAQLRARGLAAPAHQARPETAVKPGASRVPLQIQAPRPIGVPRRGEPAVMSRSTATPEAPSSGMRTASGTRPDSALVSSATYAPFGPMTSMSLGNGTTQTIAYNQRYLPQENKLVGGGRTIDDHTYTEDAAGNITAITDALDAGYNRSFAYDDLNRITTANSGTKLWGTASGNGVTYDTMGNVKTYMLGTGIQNTFTYKPGTGSSTGLPIIQTFNFNGSSGSVTSDANGSMTAVAVANSNWTYGARELLASDLPNIQSYGYDSTRHHVQTVLPDGTERVSLFDPEDHLMAESALATSSPAIAYDYVWFGNVPVAQLDSTSTHWTYADHLGTPLLQTDASTNVSWQAEYQPFGKVFALRAGDVHQPVRLPGQTAPQYDAGANGATLLSYNNARWYRPGWGRYIQADPIGLAGGPNEYSYALDNPLSNADPTGLLTIAPPVTIPFPPISLPQIPPWIIGLPGDVLGPLGGVLLGTTSFASVKGKWQCDAQCNVQPIGNCKTCPPRTFGSSLGSSQEEACRAAKRIATQNTPAGCYPRHCKCSCSKR